MERQWCLFISEIMRWDSWYNPSVPDNELEETLCKIVGKVEVKANDRDTVMLEIMIERLCWQLGRKIIKFSHRKDRQQLMNVEKGLSKLNLTDIDLDNTKVYITQILCPYYKLLWPQSKRLHAMKQIHSYYILNCTVKVKDEENSWPLSITSTSISLALILALQVRYIYIYLVVYNFYDIRLFTNQFSKGCVSFSLVFKVKILLYIWSILLPKSVRLQLSCPLLP